MRMTIPNAAPRWRKLPLVSRILQVTLLAVAALAAAPQNQDKAEVALKAAMDKEILDGNLKAAIAQYRKIAATYRGNRSVAARALLQLGQCYEKQGDAEARKTYDQLVREYGDQKEPVAAARVRLVALGKPAAGPNLRLIGKDVYVAGVSPDGRFLLQYGTDGEMDLRDLKTGQIRHIAQKPWYGAEVSPDGRQVAFFRRAKNVSELRIVGADGSAERMLWQADKGSRAWGAQWFPDGKRIGVGVLPGNGVGRLVAVSTTDGAATTLWEGKELQDPQLSPDGKSVVDTRRVRENPIADELWLWRLEDRSEVRLFEGQSTVTSPRWTPDGAGVVFLSDRRVPGATLDLWLLRTSGGKPLGIPELVKIGIGEVFKWQPMVYPSGHITRDGTYYFRRRPRIGTFQLLTAKFDPDTGKAVGASSFVSQTGGQSKSASFSRDGRWLAYLSGDTESRMSLVIQSIESGEARIVPMMPSPVLLDWAVMFPDGRSVLVVAQHPKDGMVLYRADAASGAWTPLKKPNGREVRGWPDGISPDGRTLYLHRGATNRGLTQLIAQDIETGQERELMEGAGSFALSHDGKQIAVSHPDGKDLVIDVLPAAGGPRREVYRVPGFVQAPISWTPDGRYLIFGPSDRVGPNHKTYMRVSVEGGEAQPIGISASEDGQVQFPRSFGEVRVHPNGRQLVYTALSEGFDVSEDWALENFLPKPVR
jgi:Tol biopolymer transport system component